MLLSLPRIRDALIAFRHGVVVIVSCFVVASNEAQTPSAPVVASLSSSRTVTEGQNVTLSVSVNGTAPFTYQWRKAGSPIAGATQSTLAFAPIRVADEGTYTVAITNSVSTTTSGPVVLAVNPAVPPSFPYTMGPVTFTVGDTLNLYVYVSGTSPMTFEWKRAGVTVATTSSSNYTKANVQLADAGSYTVTATNIVGSATSSAFTVNVNPVTAPVLSGPASTTVSSGGSLWLYSYVSNPGPVAFQWKKDGVAIAGATNNYYLKGEVTSADAGDYTVTATNSAGSTTSGVAKVTVSPPVAPTIYSVAEPVTVAVGDSVNLSVYAGGTGPLSYQWRKDGAAIAGATNGYYSKSNLQLTDAGTYSVVVSNTQGSAVSNGVPVTVTTAQPPVITIHPASRAVQLGSHLDLGVSATGTGQLSFQWKKDGVAIPGATSAWFWVTSNATAAVAGTYTVTVSSAQGSVTSEPCVVTVLPATAPIIGGQPASRTVREGGYFDLNANATGVPAPSYQWRKNGVPIPGATSGAYYKSNVVAADAGAYSFVATNSAGSATSDAATITVVPNSAVQIVRHPASASLLPGDYFYGLEVYPDTSTGVSVQWYRDGQAINGATSFYYYISNAQPSVAGTYHAVLTNSTGSVTSREAVVTVDANTTRPVITFVSGSYAVHGGSYANLEIATSSTSGETVQWFKNGTAIAGATSKTFGVTNFSVTSPGTYTAQVTTTAGTFTSRPIVLELLNAGVAPMITRQPAGISISAGNSAGFSVSAEGEWPLSYQWRKDGVNIPGATGETYYPYNITAAQAGVYTVVVTNRNGAVTSSGATLAVISGATAAPVFTVHPSSQVLTSGSGYLSLGVNVLNPAGVTFQWKKDGVNLPGATSSSFHVGSVTSTAAGRYAVVATNALGSVTSHEAIVSVITRATGPNFTVQPQSVGAFTGTAATFTASASGSGTISYQWRKNGVDIAGATSTSYSIANVQLSHAGNYSVLATDANGSTSSATATLTVQTGGVAPVILASPTSQTAIAGSAVSLVGSATGTPLPAYQWLKNGVALPGATSATLTFSNVQAVNAGSYAFTATNAFGSVTSGTAQLSVTVPAPVIVQQPRGGAVIAGSSIGLSVAANGTSLTYQWRKNGVAIPGETTSALILNNFQAANDGRYSVVVSNAFGSVTSADAVLAAVTVVPPTSQTVTVGGTATFSATVQSALPLVFRWAKDGAYLAGATGPTLTLTNVQPNQAGTYTLVVSTSEGSVLYPLFGGPTLAASLTVNAPPGPAIVQHPVGGSVPVGGSITLSVTATGTGFAYQWQKNGMPLPGAWGSSLVLSNVQPSDAGDYRAVLLTGGTPVYSNIARVEVVGSAFAGTYFGGSSNGDTWALHVNPDGTAHFLALLWTRNQAIVARDVSVSATGEFSFGGARGLAVDEPAIAARFHKGEVIGSISGENVTGNFIGAGIVFSGRRTSSSSGVPAGAYRAVPMGAELGEIHLIAGPDGYMLLVAVDATRVRGGNGQMQSGGAFLVTQPGQYEFRGAVAPDRQRVQGVFAPATGVSVPFDTPASAAGAERLTNVATRGLTGSGDRVLTAGFVVGGTGAKDVLLRAIGPGLQQFGVPGLLANPKVRLFRGNTAMMENDDWSLGGFATQIADIAQRVGAFGLQPGSLDAALIARLEPGQYSAQILGEGESTGVALVEVYDITEATGGAPKLINLSTRGEVGRGGDILIVGVVVSGTAPKKLLIRGIGPTLGEFGVQGVLPDPKLQLFQGATLLRENDNWESTSDPAALAAATRAVGGFSLPAGSKDAAILLYLPPGSYTAQVSGVNGATGIALVETYEVP